MHLKSWAKSQPESTPEKLAIAKLGKMEATCAGKVLIPFPIRDREVYEKAFGNKTINAAIAKSPVQAVPLDGLHGIQTSVNRDEVKDFIKDPNSVPRGKMSPRHGGPIDYPVVIQYRGERLIHDGHHRLTAALLRGEKTAMVRLTKLDAE